MIYVRPPSADEQQELKRMTRQEVGRIAQRAQLVLLSAQRRSVSELAQLFEMHRKTVRVWVRRFDAQGPAGLYDAPRSGRPRKLTETTRRTLVELIQQDPLHAGYLATLWTVAMLVLALANKLDVRLSASSVRQALHQLKLAWGRPRLTMPHKTDAHKAAKQWAIVQAVVDAGPEATVLYADESRIQLLPLIRAMWHWVGTQIRIPTPGSNVTRALFGALNIHSGQWSYLVRMHQHKEDFIAFLEHLLEVYPTGPVILIVDNYSSHTASAVMTWRLAHPRLQLYFLPTYCSHLNPVEPIWLRLKSKIAADRLYGAMPHLLETVAGFFAEMTPQYALSWAAIVTEPNFLLPT